MIRFEDLSAEEKVQLIIDNASFVISVNYHNSIAKLYALSNAFIEIEFDKEMMEVLSIKVLSRDDMNRYIRHIKIHNLL